MIQDVKEVIRLTPQQLQRIAQGETVDICPAKQGYQIVMDTTEDGLVTAEYVKRMSVSMPMILDDSGATPQEQKMALDIVRPQIVERAFRPTLDAAKPARPV